MSDIILTDKQLSASAFTAIIDVPLERVNISDWLFHPPEAEYQRCCPPRPHPLGSRAARQRDGGDPNRRETPLFAASIERSALSRSS
jgi:hypothetical protein